MRRTLSIEEPNEPLSLGQNKRDQRRVGPSEYKRRRSLLREDPDIDVVDMATLVGVAKLIEDESVRRYTMLAELMDRRGEPATAAAFRVMLEEERRHVEAVDRWADSVGEPVIAAADFEWLLPEDLSSSWDDIAGSALLTPYRAFALAVENEERAFSFYAYLSAHAENENIRAEAEKLGSEELRHAALLRKWRRRAYHRERSAPRPAQREIDSVETLRDVLAQHQSGIAEAHRGLASQLRSFGDEASAQVLERSLPVSTPWLPSTATNVPRDSSARDTDDADYRAEARHLLVDAQKPLESLADLLEAVMSTSDGDLFDDAASAMSAVIERIAQISLQIGRSSDTPR